MQYGSFDDKNREYIITRPDTPLPWINYLGTKDYFGLISNTGGGYSFYQDARLRRLIRYRYNNVPTDMGGRYIYLRDKESGDFWSPTWMPTRHEYMDYSCRHGMGYSIISSSYADIKAEIRYFVPMNETLEIWDLTVENTSQDQKTLSCFSCVEFCLWEAHEDATNFQRNLNIGELEVEDSVIFHKTEYRERRNHFAYFASSEPLTGFETQRDAFLGHYRGWENPQAVEEDQTSNSLKVGWSPVGVHHLTFTLAPGEKKRVIFLLGYHENAQNNKFETRKKQKINKSSVNAIIRHYLKPETVDRAFEELRHSWDSLLNTLQVDTPNEHVNRMVNIWNAYQCMVTFNLSRSASYFESGIGRGMGFRDSNQDILGFVQMVPERARQRILDLAATQLLDGGAYHQYQPLTKRGNDAVGSNFNDDPAWLILSVAAYLKETGDWQILEERIPYENKIGTESPLLEHLERCIQYMIENIGPHGLPLIGRADWNDCLNLNTFSEKPGESFQTTTNKEGKTAESIVIAALFTLAADELSAIMAHLGMQDESERLKGLSVGMAATTRRYGWDGNWFLRAYDYFGNKVGSNDCDEGKIFIEPQGLCALAKIGLKEGLVEKSLKAVSRHLATEHGIMLLQPAYEEYHLHLGEISSYPPGYKENASIFCHTNPWVMIAEAMLGHADMAMNYYLKINPSKREVISHLHRCEPYVYAQTIAGKDAESFGEAKNSWLTGTAAWNFVAITQWILGIRPDYDGLRIQPVIPQSWDKYQVTRRFRNTTYNIAFIRKGPGHKTEIFIDGEKLERNVIPPSEKEMVHVDVMIS